MQATLDEIYQDPTVLGRAIENGEALEILQNGLLQATMLPEKRAATPAESKAPDWWKPGGEWPDFAKRREELRKLGMRRLTPEEETEFYQLLRSDREI